MPIPAKDAAFMNAGGGSVNFAARPQGGAWKNDFHLESGKNLQYTFGADKFEIVLVSAGNKKVDKTLPCGDEYVIFFDAQNGQWDVVLVNDYHG